jgi:hypothetical protein
MTFYKVDVSDLSVRQINALFRQNDESHLWPIRGRFNVTERAIRRVRHDILRHIGSTGGCEYAAILDAEIEHIVNSNQ